MLDSFNYNRDKTNKIIKQVVLYQKFVNKINFRFYNKNIYRKLQDKLQTKNQVKS